MLEIMYPMTEILQNAYWREQPTIRAISTGPNSGGGLAVDVVSSSVRYSSSMFCLFVVVAGVFFLFFSRGGRGNCGWISLVEQSSFEEFQRSSLKFLEDLNV